MYSVTWIENGKIEAIAHPKYATCYEVFCSMLRDGKNVRFWGKNKELIL
jgi:hypothetical protein